MVQEIRWRSWVTALVLSATCGCAAQMAKPAEPPAESKDETTQVVVRAQDGNDAPEPEAPRMRKEIDPGETQSGGPLPGPADGFHFPDDRGGALLARLLMPERQPLPTDRSTGPRPRTLPRSLDNPAPELPPVALLVPRLPSGSGATKLRPRWTLEETLDGLTEPPRLIVAPLPEGPRIRLPAADLNQPAPLPLLARPLPDRASLDDPTTEVSLAEAVMGIVPPRPTPSPFQKQTLPDPFEFRQPVGQPVLAPGDEAVPMTIRSPRP
jgi:hypothetical protein